MPAEETTHFHTEPQSPQSCLPQRLGLPIYATLFDILILLDSDFLCVFQLQTLFEKYPPSGSIKRLQEQLLETVRSNIQWRANYEKPIEEWLDNM